MSEWSRLFAALGLPEWDITVWFLVAARVAPLVVVAPWVALAQLPVWARVGVTGGLLLGFAPLAWVGAEPVEWLWPAQVLVEGLLGTAFAVAASAPLFALRWSGAWMDTLAAGAPARAEGPLPDFASLFGVALFWASGAHRLAVRAFADGLVASPVGAAPPLGLGLGVARLVADAVALSVAVAAPAFAAVTLISVGLGLTRGAGPSPAVRGALVAFVFLLVLPWAADLVLVGLGESLRSGLRF